MKTVSNEYKEITSRLVRPETQFRAYLSVVDEELEDDNNITYSDKEVFSSSIFQDAPYNYITFEEDYMICDGSQIILPSSGYLADGYVSSVMSDEYGEFSPKPTIALSFDQADSLAGLTWEFYGDYPYSYTVTTYLDGTLVDSFTSEPQGIQFMDETHIEECDQIVIEFNGMNEPYRRLRIKRLDLGIHKVFDNDNLISVNHKMSVDLVSSSLPSINMRLSVMNFDKDYSPESPTGIWKYIEPNHKMIAQYGVKKDDGSIEWLDGATLLLADSPKVDGYSADFEAQDILSTLSNEYYKGTYYADGISLKDLAIDVLQDAGVTNYFVDDALDNVITYAPMPVVPHKEALQLIANAGRCILYVDASGRIVIKLQLNPKISVTDNGHMDYSTSVNIGESEATDDYITFEPNKWVIGNENMFIIPDDGDYLNTIGYVSQEISDNNGDFETYPTITLNYSVPVGSYNFKVVFDNVNGTYATDFTLSFYDGNDNVLYTDNVTGNANVEYVCPQEVLNVRKVIMEIISINKGNQRIRVANFGENLTTDYYLDYQNALSRPLVEVRETLRNALITYHIYSVESTTEQVLTQKLTISGTQTVRVEYPASCELVASVTGGTLVNSVLYAQVGFLTITGSGEVEVTINGKKLNIADGVYALPSHDKGEDCPVDNPLITSQSLASDIAVWMRNYLSMKNKYSLSFRQDFRLEANDRIYIQNDFEEYIPSIITDLEFSLPNQKGSITLRRLN